MIEIIPNWHPVFVHFTLALLTMSVVFYVISALFKNNKWQGQWLTVANWNLWLGAIFGIITALAGWYAYNTVAHDTPSHAAMTLHRNWAVVTLALFLALALWSFIKLRSGAAPTVLFLVLSVAAAGLLTVTGWLGAEVVYRHGLGVMSLPKSEGDGHDHDHGDGHGHGHNDATPSNSTAPKDQNHKHDSIDSPSNESSHSHESGGEQHDDAHTHGDEGHHENSLSEDHHHDDGHAHDH